MKHKNVIEINGRLYDARSGAPVESAKLIDTKHASKKNTAPGNGRSVDGFTRHNSKPHHSTKKVSTNNKPVANSGNNASKAIHRTPVVPHKAPLKAKRSLTLNRSAVAAPVIESRKPSVNPTPKKIESSALKHIDARRLERAKKSAKSPIISRFGNSAAVSSESDNKPVDELTSAKSALTKHLHTSHTSTHDPAQQSQKLSAKENLIKKAVDHAPVSSHRAKRHAKKKHSLSKYAPALLVFLLLSGYLAYLNVPSLSMKVAGRRAGFAASMPGYKPAGYSFSGPITASPGEVSVNFASNTDDRNFKLKQQPTTWDSTALLENLVVKKSSSYLTYQDRGLTIYIYDGSSAAWVNGGKLYQIEGSNSRLDTDQLLKIATSV